MKRLFLLLVLLFPPLLAVAAEELTPAQRLPTGIYGGDAATLAVDARSARLELSCAIGLLPQRPVLDERGTFRAEGVFRTRLLTNPPAPGRSATFHGRVVGSQLWIEVEVHGSGGGRSSYGPLTRGYPGRFFRCL
jgi:hypothetical protein